MLRYITDIEDIIDINGGVDFRDYQNAIWLLFVTITTGILFMN